MEKQRFHMQTPIINFINIPNFKWKFSILSENFKI